MLSGFALCCNTISRFADNDAENPMIRHSTNNRYYPVIFWWPVFLLRRKRNKSQSDECGAL
jgi:hypothetical protein